MKSVIKICNMESNDDAKIIQDTVVKNSGVIATEISLAKREITVIYNDIFFKTRKNYKFYRGFRICCFVILNNRTILKNKKSKIQNTLKTYEYVLKCKRLITTIY